MSQTAGSLRIAAVLCCSALVGLAPLQRCPAGSGVHLGMLLPQARLVVLSFSSNQTLSVHLTMTRIFTPSID